MRKPAAAVALLLLTGCSSTAGPRAATTTVTVTAPPVTVILTPSGSKSPAPSHNSRSQTVSASAGAAEQALLRLPVKGRAAKTGYDRAEFGQAWSDDVSVSGGHNGCDTRNDVLRRDLTAITLKPTSNGCTVLTGTLTDPYSGTVLGFVRGPQSARVQIDHVVALSNAWQTGAQQLSAADRQDLANDPLNLIATVGSLNASKGAGDAATWLPPRKAERCAYVSRQIAVKTHYRLWLTPPERSAMLRILATCPAQRLPTTASTATPDPD